MERRTVLKALVGSWNYNLNDESSDKDYKVFHLPTFEDLYHGKMFHEQTVTPTEDNDRHDIRKLIYLLWKANLSYTEALFSVDLKFTFVSKEVAELINLRESIAKMNLPHLYNSCIGQYKAKISNLAKGTEGTQHLVEKYGFDTKQGMHAYRNLDFIARYHETGFTDFEAALRYSDNEAKDMLAIKYGECEMDDLIAITEAKYSDLESKIKNDYMSTDTDEKLKEHLDNLVINMVRKNF